MDNHRLALWCWWQHLDDAPLEWNFLHIDRHYDALWQQLRPWSKHYDASHRVDLSAFRQAKFAERDDEFELYRWDVITSALLTLHGDKIHTWAFATAGEGVPPALPKLQIISPWGLPAQLRWMAKTSDQESPAIVDIDIDYFTHQDDDGLVGRIFSDQYLRELGSALNEGLADNRFGVVTLALSPTTTGSWQLAEELCFALLDGHPDLADLRAGAP